MTAPRAYGIRLAFGAQDETMLFLVENSLTASFARSTIAFGDSKGPSRTKGGTEQHGQVDDLHTIRSMNRILKQDHDRVETHDRPRNSFPLIDVVPARGRRYAGCQSWGGHTTFEGTHSFLGLHVSQDSERICAICHEVFRLSTHF